MEGGNNGFVIVVDSQESKYPYMFSGELIIRKQLLIDGIRTGDYSIKGFERYAAIERKTVQDLYSSLSSSRRDRFITEMYKLGYFECKALVVEGTYDQVINPPATSYLRKFSHIKREAVLGSLVKIQVECGVPIVFVGSRRNGEEWTLHTLKMYYDKKHKGAI